MWNYIFFQHCTKKNLSEFLWFLCGFTGSGNSILYLCVSCQEWANQIFHKILHGLKILIEHTAWTIQQKRNVCLDSALCTRDVSWIRIILKKFPWSNLINNFNICLHISYHTYMQQTDSGLRNKWTMNELHTYTKFPFNVPHQSFSVPLSGWLYQWYLIFVLLLISHKLLLIVQVLTTVNVITFDAEFNKSCFRLLDIF